MELIAPIKTDSNIAHYYALDESGELCIVRIDTGSNIAWNYMRDNKPPIIPMILFLDNIVPYNSDINYNIAVVTPINEFGMNIDTWLSRKFGGVILADGDVFTLNSEGTRCKINFGARIKQIKSYAEYLVVLTTCGKFLAVEVGNCGKICPIEFNIDLTFNDITFEYSLLLSNDGDLYKLPSDEIADLIKNNNNVLQKFEANTRFKMCIDEKNIIDVDDNLWNYDGIKLKMVNSLCRNTLKSDSIGSQHVRYCNIYKKMVIISDNNIICLINDKPHVIQTKLPSMENIVSIHYNNFTRFMMIEMTDRKIYCCEIIQNTCEIVGEIPMTSILSKKSARKV